MISLENRHRLSSVPEVASEPSERGDDALSGFLALALVFDDLQASVVAADFGSAEHGCLRRRAWENFCNTREIK